MKKLLLCIGILVSITKVYAFEKGAWTDEIVNAPNVFIEKSEVRYRWYQNVSNYSSDYYLEGENDMLYPEIDRNSYIETAYSEWNEEIPFMKANRVIESRGIGRHRTLRPVRYLFLQNFSGGYLTFNIAELNVLIDNNKLFINTICVDCSPNFDQDISDGQFKNVAYVNNGGSLRIDLGAYYGIEQIKLELYMYDEVPNTKKFDLYFNEGPNLSDCNYAYKEIVSYVVSATPYQPEKYLIIADASFIVNPIFSDWVYDGRVVNTTYYRQMQFISQYRYSDLNYRYYKKERQYLSGYYSEIPKDDYIRDEESAKTFYLYDYLTDDINTNDNLVQSAEIIKNDVSEDTSNTHQHTIINKETWEDESSKSLETVKSLDNIDGVNNEIAVDSSYVNVDVTKTNVDEISSANIEKDSLSDRNCYKKTLIKVDDINSLIKKFNYRITFIYLIMILILLVVLIKLIHHNLSHQN